MKEIGRNPIEKKLAIKRSGQVGMRIKDFFYYGLTYLTVIHMQYLGFIPVSEGMLLGIQNRPLCFYSLFYRPVSSIWGQLS
jgi:hypothetical protein